MKNNVLVLSSLVACVAAFIGCVDNLDVSPEAGTDHLTQSLSSPKDITSFGLLSNPSAGLVTSAFATITGTSIAVAVPPGVNVTGLTASFTTTGVRVSVGGVTQVSGTTPNDFTNPVIYTVTGTDGTTQDYTVTVTALLTSFSFTGLTSTATTFPSDGVNPNLTTPPVMSLIGGTANNGAGGFGGLIWNTAAPDPGHYLSFTVTPVAGAAMTLTKLALCDMRNGTGAQLFSIRSSLDNFTADLQVFTSHTGFPLPPIPNDFLVLGASFANLTTPVEFRFFPFAAASLGLWRMDSVQLTGVITP